jgi:phospholipid/cholesterol/gamma-HCH transport system permease protein
MEVAAKPTSASCRIEHVAGGARVVWLGGDLTNATVSGLWRQVVGLDAGQGGGRSYVVDVSKVGRLDGAGMALLLKLQCQALGAGLLFELRGLSPEYRRLMERFDPREYSTLEPHRPVAVPIAVQVGRTTAGIWGDIRVQVEFIGELVHSLVAAILNPRRVRWRDLWVTAERAGADALPIVALICGLVGLVLAFQASMAMRPYGAEIYVAVLVTVAMLRELGPLMTAIILAGRSGGAFAAEIGTMKVNDEVAALTVMGLDPVPFLVVPRVVGLVLMIPILTLFGNLMGVLGGALMFLTLEYPISTYFDQAIAAAELRHLLSGLAKSVAFGVTVAGVGCLRGLQTLRGSSAVGHSTTRAVVTSILLIVVIDAVLGTVFYFLGF